MRRRGGEDGRNEKRFWVFVRLVAAGSTVGLKKGMKKKSFGARLLEFSGHKKKRLENLEDARNGNRHLRLTHSALNAFSSSRL